MKESPLQGQDNVAMWQTGSSSMYMAQQQQQQQQDSGVHSVSTTQAPSIRSGFEEEMDFPGGISTGPGSVAGASICDMESLPHSEVSSVHSSTMGGTMNSEEAIMKHIPNFIGGLNDDDPTVRDGILQSMERFVKSSKFVQTIVKSPPLMRALIQVSSLINTNTVTPLQCSSLKRPSVKRPSRLIDQFSQIPNDQFTSNLPG